MKHVRIEDDICNSTNHERRRRTTILPIKRIYIIRRKKTFFSLSLFYPYISFIYIITSHPIMFHNTSFMNTTKTLIYYYNIPIPGPQPKSNQTISSLSCFFTTSSLIRRFIQKNKKQNKIKGSHSHALHSMLVSISLSLYQSLYTSSDPSQSSILHHPTASNNNNNILYLR
mmetsp:Transcript_20789/g.22605  ORF Transcript_20789/g.22605 Transcript_20789/m.22605 type:complete len:171 (-) Transcript_20789:116-628(-)